MTRLAWRLRCWHIGRANRRHTRHANLAAAAERVYHQRNKDTT